MGMPNLSYEVLLDGAPGDMQGPRPLDITGRCWLIGIQSLARGYWEEMDTISMVVGEEST